MTYHSKFLFVVAACVFFGLADRLTAAPVDLINDNFNSEAAGPGTTTGNYNSFQNFSVTRGSVDLINNSAGWGNNVGIFGHGLFVDLDGSTNSAGKMESQVLTLAPGTYTLTFDLAGSQRNDHSPTDTVTVSLGGLFSQAITLPYDAPFGNNSFTITTGSTSTGSLVFDASGGDNQGLLLDNVHLTFTPASPTPVPEPASVLLWGMGAVGVAVYQRRQAQGKRRQVD